MTLFSHRTIFGGCNLPQGDGRFRRPWPLAHLRVLSDRVTVRPIGTRTTWDAGFNQIEGVQLIQLSLGQAVRIACPDGDWYIYTYEAGALALELVKAGVPHLKPVARLKVGDLPK